MQNFDWLSRTALITGPEALQKLSSKHVLIVGLGGVGSFAAEAICRAGIGKMTIVDGDTVEASNRNRQLVALCSNEDEAKAQIMAKRIRDINPEIELEVIEQFMEPHEIDKLLETPFDYVMDCIDSVTPKATLLEKAYHKGYNVVSSLGAGGKLDPTSIRVSDLMETYNCKLGSYLRQRVKRLGVRKGIKAAYSVELPIKESLIMTDGSNYKRSAYGTISYMPAMIGMTAASIVIRDLLGYDYPLHTRFGAN